MMMMELEANIEMLSLASRGGLLGDAELLLLEIIEALGEDGLGPPIEALGQAAIALVEGFIDILMEFQDCRGGDDQLGWLVTALAENAPKGHESSYPVR